MYVQQVTPSNGQRNWQNALSTIPAEIALTPVINKRPLRDNWVSEPVIAKGELLTLLRNGQALTRKDPKPGEPPTWHCQWDGVGIRLGRISGGILAIDCDGPSAFEHIQQLSRGRGLPKTVAFTSGRKGRAQYLFRVPKEVWNSIKTTKFETGITGDDGEGEQLEFRWDGCQSVLPPSSHPLTGRYFYLEGCSFEECEIALAEDWMGEAMLPDRRSTGDTSQSAPSTEETIERARAYLAKVSPRLADNYDTWLQVGMGLHSVSDTLLEDWELWSQQSPKHEVGVCQRKWDSFKIKSSDVNLGTLAHLAKQESSKTPVEVSLSDRVSEILERNYSQSARKVAFLNLSISTKQPLREIERLAYLHI